MNDGVIDRFFPLWKSMGKERRRVFLVLYDLSRKYGSNFVSQKKIAKISKYSLRTVENVFQSLKKLELLKVKRRRRQSSIYFLNEGLKVDNLPSILKAIERDTCGSKCGSRILSKPNVDKASEPVKTPLPYIPSYINTRNEYIHMENPLEEEFQRRGFGYSIRKTLSKFSTEVVDEALGILTQRELRQGSVPIRNSEALLIYYAQGIQDGTIDVMQYRLEGLKGLPDETWRDPRELSNYFFNFSESEIVTAVERMAWYPKQIDNKPVFFYKTLKNLNKGT